MCVNTIITATIMISIMMIILQLNEMRMFGIYVLPPKTDAIELKFVGE